MIEHKLKNGKHQIIDVGACEYPFLNAFIKCLSKHNCTSCSDNYSNKSCPEI